MANTTYKDDSVVYNFEKDIIYTRGCEFVPNGDLLKVAEEQLKSGEKLNSWIIRDNSDMSCFMINYLIMIKIGFLLNY